MPDFTVRIQLHDATPEDDARLHAAMLQAGHTDHLKSKDGTAWVLPAGEFNLRADLEGIMSAAHWSLALQTGIVTGALALFLSFTPVGRLYGHRWGNALLVGMLTAFADAWSHPNHFGFEHAEALLTGLVSALLVLAGSYLFEDRARRVRAAWARLTAGR